MNALLQDYVNAWNTADIESLMSFFSEEVVYQDIALKKNLDFEGVREFAEGAFQNYKSLRFEIVSLCDAGDCLSWEWRMIGERQTGEKIDVPGMSMTQLSGNKISENRDYWSTLPPST